MEFLSLKELHRLPPLSQDQTSARLRYLTATTNAAQRLRAVGAFCRPLTNATRYLPHFGNSLTRLMGRSDTR